MKTTYRFSPQEDLSALDLAELLNIADMSQADFKKLPARLQRHFQAAQVFESVPDVRPAPIEPAFSNDIGLHAFGKSARRTARKGK